MSEVAPPGMTSSAGWNSRRTRPGSSPAAVHLGQGEAGADQAGRVHVVPARVRDAGAGADPGVGGEVVDRERVEVGSQGHAAAPAR